MAWSTPKTWTSGYVVLASDLNTYIKNQQLVTAPAVLTAQGDLLYASGANAPARLAKDTNSTRSLTNTGGSNNPAWAQVALATGVSGTLPVGNGGTNVSSLADKSVLITQDSGTDTVTAAAMTTSGQVLIGGASGPAVATLTAGSGMAVTNGDGTIELSVTGGGVAATKMYTTTTDPGTTRTTMITPTGGTAIRMISIEKIVNSSGATGITETYFGTGANISSDATKAISKITTPASEYRNYFRNWPAGDGPVGATNDVLSIRNNVLGLDGVELTFVYTEE